MPRRAFVHRLSAGRPDDVAPLEAAAIDGRIRPESIVAILGKTEGNGCVNDFSRPLATTAIHSWLAGRIGPALAARVALIMSGGTEGGLAPHWLVLEAREVDDRPAADGALAIGIAHTRPLPGEALGRLEQVELVAEAVRSAMAKAGIADVDAVHFVQVKCPLLTASRSSAVRRRGQTVATDDTLKSMGLSRGASALGVAVALGEIAPAQLSDAAIGHDAALYSARASCSAGIELAGHEIVVLGSSDQWAGDLVVRHAVMADALDVEAVRACLGGLGLAATGQLSAGQRTRIVALLAKAEAASSGRIRGHRHTMLDDSDISATRHARALVGGVLAGLIGHAEIFVSGGAEHQGPDGGGPVAIIARRSRRTTGTPAGVSRVPEGGSRRRARSG